MKRSVRIWIAAGSLFALVGTGAFVHAQTPTPSLAPQLAESKAVFERACGVCHGLDRPLSKTFDKVGWEKTVERMASKGAKVSVDERAQVVAYLLAKNTFEAKCSSCHPTDRPLGASKSPAGWLSTVQRMSGKKPGHLTDAETAEIAAYLALTRPLP